MFDIRMGEGNGLVLSGRLDASQAPRAEQVLDTLDRSVEADLAGLEYVSSAGLAVLVKTQLRLQKSGHRLRLRNVQPQVRAVLHFAAVDGFLGIE